MKIIEIVVRFLFWLVLVALATLSIACLVGWVSITLLFVIDYANKGPEMDIFSYETLLFPVLLMGCVSAAALINLLVRALTRQRSTLPKWIAPSLLAGCMLNLSYTAFVINSFGLSQPTLYICFCAPVLLAVLGWFVHKKGLPGQSFNRQ